MVDAQCGRPCGRTVSDAAGPNSHPSSDIHPNARGDPHGHGHRGALADTNRDAFAHSNAHADTDPHADSNRDPFANPYGDVHSDFIADTYPTAHADTPCPYSNPWWGRWRWCAASAPTSATRTRSGPERSRLSPCDPHRHSPAQHGGQPGRTDGGRGPCAARRGDRLATSAISQ